jgi:glycosyltransferase involved in cell wall biosynthesis
MPRILHIITGLNQGGAERMLARVVLGLDRQVIEQKVVSLTNTGAFGDAIKSQGISVLSLGMSGILTIPRTLYRLRQIIAEYRPDIVQTWLYHADLFGLLAARLGGDACVAWNIRCAALAPGDVSLGTQLVIKILAILSPKADAMIFNSAAGQRSHREIGYRPRVGYVIPNGFDLQNWRPDINRRKRFRSAIGVSEQVFLVGMVARLHRMKDHGCFFEAAAIIAKMESEVKFILVGEGLNWDNKELVADIDKFKLRNFTILLDLRRDIENVMSGLECLVLTSTSEGFPNVIGEAMASGVPCVSTDAGDARTIIGDTGYVVSVGDSAGVASGILGVKANVEKYGDELAMRCRKRIAESYDIKKIVGSYADFYKGLNEKRRNKKDK